MFHQTLIDNMSQDELIQYSDIDPRCATALARSFDGGDLDAMQIQISGLEDDIDAAIKEQGEAEGKLEAKDELLIDIGDRRDEILEEFAAGDLDESKLAALFDSISEAYRI